MSQAIVKERERGTLEQLFVTPIGRTEYLLGKLLPYIGVAFVQVSVTFVVGVLWFRVPFSGSLLVLGGGLMLFMLSALGIGHDHLAAVAAPASRRSRRRCSCRCRR